ncbi:MAG TPA: hypothetical protein VFV67_36605 [Actinophytocola sp.]|uniref:hypothetical protein n=1 Tax=Actinophytocola sp. TaxID=1872138 RepID=UPI002DB81DC4|nr:hypothetical protein [Actinophytocola sp.]HEU5476179.1 hypothetical protein [Actinophytocola sp.]
MSDRDAVWERALICWGSVMRCHWILPACALLLVGSVVVVPVLLVRPAVAEPVRVVGEAPDEVAAVAAARVSGRRVEVVSARTETAQVFANPSGTMTLEQHTLPVRVRRGGVWVPVDSTLRVRGGWVEPVAATVDFRFSNGGDGPLVVLSKGERRLMLGWPGRLPVPAVSGDRVTYSEVLPGVDLQGVADPSGPRLLVVVKTREAARHPAVRRIGYRWSGEGLAVRRDGSGAVSVVDAAGEPVFRVGAPIM